MKKYLYTLLALMLTNGGYAQMHKEHIADSFGLQTWPYYRYEQHSVKKFSLLLGYNFGKHDFAEVGFSLLDITRKRSKTRYTTFFISSELKVRQTFLMAPKIGCWAGRGLGAGISGLYYTDLNGNTTIRIRPEAGVISEGMKLMYGYNIPVTNATFGGVSAHVVSLAFSTGLVKISEKKKERDWNPTERKREEEKGKDTTYSKNYAVLLVGVHGLTDVFGEVGIAMYSDESMNKNNKMNILGFLSTEFKLTDQTIIAPKVGMYFRGTKKVSAGFGTSLIYYTGMRHSSLAVRPEVGLNAGMLRLSCGYNHIFTNYTFPSVGKINLSAVMGLKLGKGKGNMQIRSVGRF